MKFLDKKISDSYFQIYIILDFKEKKSIIRDVKEKLLFLKKEEIQSQINLYKNINKNSNSSQSKLMYEQLKEELQTISVDNSIFNEKDVIDGIGDILLKDILDHIERLNIIQVFQHDASIIGSLDDNNPLTYIYSFCYISYDFDMVYPKAKGNAYLFTNKDIDMIQTEILLANKYYKKRKVLFSTEFSDLLFSYMCEDDMKFNLYMDISEIESKFQIDRSELVGLERNKYLLRNNYGKQCIINIKDIYDKDVEELNEEIVKKLNYLESKNIKEFRKNIENVFSFIYNINSNVMSLLQNIAKINSFCIDDYVMKHYCKLINEECNELSSQMIEEMRISFVTSYIFAKYDINIEKYFFYLEQEYNLLYQIKKPDDNKTFEEYINMKAPYYALYEFFKGKNLVTERSYNE